MTTTTVTTWQPHPLSKPLVPGDVVWTWCSQAMDRTDHLYTGYKLVCLHCHPEQDPRRDEENVQDNANQKGVTR